MAHVFPLGVPVVRYADGSRFEGTFVNGQRDGNGQLSWANGSVYEGSFQSDMRHGQGTFTGSDGSTYKGAWRSGKKHGAGTLTYGNGGKYEGAFANDAFEGHGQFTSPDGSVVKGTFKGGTLNGQGVYTQKDGRRYEGAFVSSKRNGKGVLTYADGSSYDGGEFGREGKDAFQPAEVAPLAFGGAGSRALRTIAEWKNDKQDGQGVYKCSSGAVKYSYRGAWKVLWAGMPRPRLSRRPPLSVPHQPGPYHHPCRTAGGMGKASFRIRATCRLPASLMPADLLRAGCSSGPMAHRRSLSWRPASRNFLARAPTLTFGRWVGPPPWPFLTFSRECMRTSRWLVSGPRFCSLTNGDLIHAPARQHTCRRTGSRSSSR